MLITVALLTACSNNMINDSENTEAYIEAIHSDNNNQKNKDLFITYDEVEEAKENTNIHIEADSLEHEINPLQGQSATLELEKTNKKDQLPEGFVYLNEVVPYATYDMRYYSSNNFVGERIIGYEAPLAIGTKEMAQALAKVSEELYQEGYTLLIYDSYRPAKAVAFFKEWSMNGDESMKEKYYPNEHKNELFKRGYLSSKSGHSRGSTVDLTLVYKDTNELVDMGSEYDLLDEISSFNTTKITEEQANNRKILMNAMIKHGFKEYSKEWWHYVLKSEPYPKTYFDFNIE